MVKVVPAHLDQLVAIESHVHYSEPRPPGVANPFVVVERPSPVLLSAPHGARCFYNAQGEGWHEEDEYTAGMALLLSELCGTSVIATIWRSDETNPNSTPADACAYKGEVRRLVETLGIRWAIDLHGLRLGRLDGKQVDLGTRKREQSMPAEQLDWFVNTLETHLGRDMVSRNLFPAHDKDCRITGFCHGTLGIHAVQVEMEPPVRTVFRRVDGSAFRHFGPFAAPPEQVMGMMQALADFVDYLERLQ